MLNTFDFVGLSMKNLSQAKQSKLKNNTELYIQYTKLINLALSQFRYEGLPDSFNEWFFEYSLLTGGCATICKDPLMGILGLKAGYGGDLNVYGYPIKIFAWGANGYTHEYTNYLDGSDNTEANAVIFFDNPARTPPITYIFSYAERLADCMRTIDVAMKKLKNPYFITAPKEMVDSVKQVLKQVDNNENSVITNSSLSPEAFQVIPTHVDNTIIAQLFECYTKIYDIIKEFLGIKNINNSEKRERLITSEADNSDMITNTFTQMRLYERQKGIEQVNKLFGLNAEVMLRDPYDAFNEYVNMEDDENGEVSKIQGPDNGTEE